MLTLNTHLPFESAGIPADLQSACDQTQAGKGPCELIAAHGSLLAMLREMLVTLSRAPNVVIVGDHAPPFPGRKDRLQFNDRVVPAIIMTPRVAKSEVATQRWITPKVP